MLCKDIPSTWSPWPLWRGWPVGTIQYSTVQYSTVQYSSDPQYITYLFSMLQEEPSKQASSSVTKPKSHECKKCKKVFSKVSLLNRHMKLHLGIKPFQCNVSLLENICDNWQLNDLCLLFLCQICGWGFLQSYNLKKHIQTHGNKSLRCSQCKASFPDKTHLRAHVLRKHNQVT